MRNLSPSVEKKGSNLYLFIFLYKSHLLCKQSNVGKGCLYLYQLSYFKCNCISCHIYVFVPVFIYIYIYQEPTEPNFCDQTKTEPKFLLKQMILISYKFKTTCRLKLIFELLKNTRVMMYVIHLYIVNYNKI